MFCKRSTTCNNEMFCSNPAEETSKVKIQHTHRCLKCSHIPLVVESLLQVMDLEWGQAYIELLVLLFVLVVITIFFLVLYNVYPAKPAQR